MIAVIPATSMMSTCLGLNAMRHRWRQWSDGVIWIMPFWHPQNGEFRSNISTLCFSKFAHFPASEAGWAACLPSPSLATTGHVTATIG